MFNGGNHIFCAEFQKYQSPFLINLANMQVLPVAKKETIKKWDFVSTFKPSAHLSIENGKIFKIEKVTTNSQEYEFVTNMFLSTFHGIP